MGVEFCAENPEGEFRLANPIPEELVEFARKAARQIARDLGESPEAWRGAAVLGWLIKSGAIAEAESAIHNGDGGPLEMSESCLVFTFVVALLELYPGWPEGVAGEPMLHELKYGDVE